MCSKRPALCSAAAAAAAAAAGANIEKQKQAPAGVTCFSSYSPQATHPSCSLFLEIR
jgi:hypothetical protein